MIRFPWWGSVLLAIVAYSGLKYCVPEYIGHENQLSGLFALLAPIVAMGLLLWAGKQLYDGDTGGHSDPEQDHDVREKQVKDE